MPARLFLRGFRRSWRRSGRANRLPFDLLWWFFNGPPLRRGRLRPLGLNHGGTLRHTFRQRMRRRFLRWRINARLFPARRRRQWLRLLARLAIYFRQTFLRRPRRLARLSFRIGAPCLPSGCRRRLLRRRACARRCRLRHRRIDSRLFRPWRCRLLRQSSRLFAAGGRNRPGLTRRGRCRFRPSLLSLGRRLILLSAADGLAIAIAPGLAT